MEPIFEYQIDGRPIPAPDARARFDRKDLSAPDAGLDEGGFYHGFLLRRGLRTWEFTCKVLSGADHRRLLELLCGKGSFLFRFRDEEGLPAEARCRCGALEARLYDRKQDVYTDVRFRVEEC